MPRGETPPPNAIREKGRNAGLGAGSPRPRTDEVPVLDSAESLRAEKGFEKDANWVWDCG